MRQWLKRYFRKATVKLPFLDAEFGPEPITAPHPAGNEQVASPKPAPATAVTTPKLVAEPEPVMSNEPEPEAQDLLHPVSLQGTAFEGELRRHSEVAARLRNENHKHVAARAIDYLINGVAPDNDRDKKKDTWSQIRGACLEQIIDTLNRHGQRATYGAVAGIVGGSAQSVMQGKPRVHRNSWVVAKATHLPTGYTTEEKHPALEKRSLVLVTPNYLREWLANPI